MRPKALIWYELQVPAWIAVKGFALTPEVGGVAAHDRHGPAWGGAVALVRRFQTGAILAVGGRHVGQMSDPPVRVAIAIDGHVVSNLTASPQERSYVTILHLRPDQLQGDGPYATVTILSQAPDGSERPVPVTVEQFDYQPLEGSLVAWTSGWHEPELRPRTGETWRWASRHATLFIHRGSGAPAELTVRGDMPPLRRGTWSQIQVTSAGQVLDRFVTRTAFSRRILVPGATSPDTCDIEITFDSTAWMVPANEHRSTDRRELAFRVFDLDLESR
jgi:hypothetical protein